MKIKDWTFGQTLHFLANYKGIPVISKRERGFGLDKKVIDDWDFIKRYKKNLIAVIFARLIIVPAISLSVAIMIGFREIDLVSLIGIFASPLVSVDRNDIPVAQAYSMQGYSQYAVLPTPAAPIISA